jgi:hypothetical protein
MNRELAARKAFYYPLLGMINIPGGSGDKVPISDSKANEKDNLYILIESQTASDRSEFKTRRWNGTLSLTICHKQDDSYTRDIVDDICEQVEAILTPGIASLNGLQSESGWQITNVSLNDISYADFQISETQTICIKFLTFNFIITKI